MSDQVTQLYPVMQALVPWHNARVTFTFTLEVSLPSPDFNGDGNVNFADFSNFVGK